VNLTDIIKASAARMAHVDVDINSGLPTVCISAPGEEDIFMQGEEAEAFIAEVGKLYDESGDVTYDECALHAAEAYCENLWS
jgi:hypothetical protein